MAYDTRDVAAYINRAHTKQTIQVGMALTSSASAAASGIVSSILIAAAGVTLDSLKGVLRGYIGKNMGLAAQLQTGDIALAYDYVENYLEPDYKLIIDALKAGIGQGVGATHAGLYENLSGAGHLLAAYNSAIHQEAIGPYLARWARRRYTPSVPDAATSFRLLRRGSISSTEYIEYVRQDGWSDALRGKLEADFYEVPILPVLNDLFWRGAIDDGAWTRAMRASMFDDGFIEAMKTTREVIPPLPDLINMAVKEAFPVEAGRPQFEAMQAWAARRGLNPWWVERYWWAHFIRMSVERAIDNFVRGYWDEDRLRAHMTLMDIHPDDHDAIIRTMYGTPTIYQMRQGYIGEVYTREDLERFYRWRLLSPADATKAADATIAYALNSEKNSLISEWCKDFEDGLIYEMQLRQNLMSVKCSAERIDYYVARSKIRRERTHKKDLLDLYEDAYLKDLINDEELQGHIAEIIVDLDARELRYETAYVKKYRKPKAEAA